MDFIDLLHGHSSRNFWTMAKIDLASMLVAKHAHPVHPGETYKILNIGVGLGNELPVLRGHGEVDILDMNRHALDLIPDELVNQKIVGDATDLPFDDGTYHAVIAFDVLEHINQDISAIQEARRVLRPGGCFLATVPAFPRLYGKHDELLGHHRRYTKIELHEKLGAFKTVSISFWNALAFPAIMVQRFLWRKYEPERAVTRFSRTTNMILFHALRLETSFMQRGCQLPLGLSLVIECIA